MPPVPAFYARPKTIDEMVGHTVGRAPIAIPVTREGFALFNEWLNTDTNAN